MSLSPDVQKHRSPSGDMVHYYWSTTGETNQADFVVVWTKATRDCELEVVVPGRGPHQFAMDVKPMNEEHCDTWLRSFVEQGQFNEFIELTKRS